MSNRDAALENVLKELSEIRAKMNHDEQAYLDAIVTKARRAEAADAYEVEAHALRNVTSQEQAIILEDNIALDLEKDVYVIT